MNRTFDYNGSLVAPSKPVRALRTVKKTLHIDSVDRDIQKYFTNGDVVYYLPRVYENVVSIRLKSATFPSLVTTGVEGALTHSYGPEGSDRNGQNIPTTWGPGGSTSDAPVSYTQYFVVEIEGLNKTDEATVGSNKSTFSDSFFARIPVNLSQNGEARYFVNYNDHTEEENIARYSPAIGKLDRLHIVTRLHDQQGKKGFIYWTSTGAKPASNDTVVDPESQYSLTFEIEYLDNVFDDFSSFESRIGDRADGFSRT